jgi:hypothetical protein
MSSSKKLFPSPRNTKPHGATLQLQIDSDTYSSISMSSTFRHHNSPFAVPTPTKPEPVLVKDVSYKPKTTGSVGLMIVGLGGANGTTLLAGLLANRRKLQWHGPLGEPRSYNYYGCITQLNSRGGGVGYRDRVKGLADFNLAAVGGWVSVQPFKTDSLLLCPL